MATADSTCAAAGVGTTTSSSTTTTTTAAAADPVEACKQALDDVKTAQAAVSTAQKQLATASSQLDALLAQQAAAAGSGGTGTTGGAPTSGSAPSGSTGSSPSSADLVKYQKAVDAAEAEVTAAQQAVAQATIVSPIAGTVVAVNLARRRRGQRRLVDREHRHRRARRIRGHDEPQRRRHPPRLGRPAGTRPHGRHRQDARGQGRRDLRSAELLELQHHHDLPGHRRPRASRYANSATARRRR